MIRQAKAKTAKGARVLKAKSPQLVEQGGKHTLFLKTNSSSLVVASMLEDLFSLRKPDATLFSRKHEALHPFEADGVQSIEHYASKNEAGIIVLGSHTKKRPDTLTWVRTFNHTVLDMVEVGLESGLPIDAFPEIKKPAVGNRPLCLFHGDAFVCDPDLSTFRSILLDTFRGDATAEKLDLKGLDHAISFTAILTPTPTGLKRRVLMRVYAIQLMKSGTRTPRVELVECGPRYNFAVRRTQLANADMWKEALRVPKQVKEKRQKNVEHDAMGDKMVRIHMERQDFSKLQTRKMKGLKRSASAAEGEEEDRHAKMARSDDNEESD